MRDDDLHDDPVQPDAGAGASAFDDGSAPPELSAAGRRRRQAILRAALASAGRRRKAQTVRRASAVVLTLVAVAGLAQLTVPREDAPSPPSDPSQLVDRGDPPSRPGALPRPESQPTLPPAPPAPVLPTALPPIPRPVVVVRAAPEAVTVTTIRTDANLLAEMAVPRAAGGWQRIGTDELLRELDRVGLAGGVIVRDGKPRLWLPATAGTGG